MDESAQAMMGEMLLMKIEIERLQGECGRYEEALNSMDFEMRGVS
jgi:hypothetical protein